MPITDDINCEAYPEGTMVPYHLRDRTIWMATCGRCGRKDEFGTEESRSKWLTEHAADHLRWTLNASLIDKGKVAKASPGETIDQAAARFKKSVAYTHLCHNDRVFALNAISTVLCFWADLS